MQISAVPDPSPLRPRSEGPGPGGSRRSGTASSADAVGSVAVCSAAVCSGLASSSGNNRGLGLVDGERGRWWMGWGWWEGVGVMRRATGHRGWW